MKIIMIECDAEEMKANRSIMDTLTDAVNKFADSMFGVNNISRESVISALANANEEEEGDGE